MLSLVKIPLVDRRRSGIAELGDLRIVDTERVDTYDQCLVVRGNLTELRIEVFRGDVLLLQDFEETREGRFRDPELFGEALKLLGGEPLGLCDDDIATSTQIMGGKATELPPD